MTTPKHPSPPAGGKPPRVHHVPPSGGNPTPVQSPVPDDTFNPGDYQNPFISDFLKMKLPLNITMDGNQPIAASPEPPIVNRPPIPSDQAARKVGDDIYAGLTVNTDTYWECIGEAARFGFLLDGFVLREVRRRQPFNSTQICDGGLAVIRAIQSTSRASCMEVDPVALGEDIAKVLRARRAKEVIGGIYNILDANESAALARVSDTVAAGLAVGASVIASDGNLTQLLQPALAIRSAPAAAAQTTRTANLRTDQAIRADEQAKAKAAAPATASESPTPPVVAPPGPAKK